MNKTIKTSIITFVTLLTLGVLTAGYKNYKEISGLREICQSISEAKRELSNSNSTVEFGAKRQASVYENLYGCHKL